MFYVLRSNFRQAVLSHWTGNLNFLPKTLCSGIASIHSYIGEESSSRLSALFKDTYMASAGLTPSIFCYKTSDLPLSRTPLYTEGVSIKNRSVPMAYPFEILHSTSREQYAVNG